LDLSTVKESVPTDESWSISKNRKVISAVIPEVKVGSFVEYIIEEDTYNPFKKDFFFPKFGFQSGEPVYLSEFTVKVPKNVKLYYVTSKMPKGTEKPIVSYENGYKKYVWSVKNVPPMVDEPYAPGYWEIAPYVLCSTLKTWKPFLEWEKSFLVDRLEVTPLIKKTTLEIVKDCKTKEEKLAKLYHWMQQNIRYLSVKSGIGSGWSGHKAEITLKHKFGDCIDKAILFSTMLKVVGIEAYPVGLLTNNTYRADYRLPHFNNNHAITYVNFNGKEFFLDTTSENYRYPYFRDDDQGVYCHNAMKDRIDFIPLPDPKDNAMHFLYYMKMNKKGDINLLYTKRYSGSYEAGARGWWKRQREDLYGMYIRQDINSMKAGAKLLGFRFFNVHDISKPFFYYWKVNLKDYLIKEGDIYIMDMPWSEESFGYISLDERQYPIMFSSREWVTSTYILKLPKNMKVKYIPKSFARWYKDIMFCNYSYDVNKKTNTVILTVSVKRMKDRVMPEEYKGFKKFLEEFTKTTKQKLILTEVK
jgi:transglutaminase-like putative cysteine protease